MDVLQVDKPAFLADEEFTLFEDATGRFLDQHATPDDIKRWEDAGIIDRALWTKAGQAGLLGVSVPAEYGGAGGDFRHEAVIIDQTGRRGLESFGLTLHNAIVAPYVATYGDEEQKQRWLPGIVSGELVTAIAMTEPGAGSDLQGVRTSARRDGDDYVINGQKTFITNGQTANLICVVVKTDPTQGSRGTSLLFVETDKADGFRRGRNLDKIGLKAQDTSELFFDDVRVPAANLLGGSEGQGFYQLMQKLPQERLVIALQGMAMIERALRVTIDYVKQRKAFGKALADFQNTQFKLAECKTEATIAKVFVNHCTGLLLEGKLDAATASMAKYWVTDLQGKIIDECLQLFGGYGYMNEYPIAQMYRDARVQRIYGGANEIMKVLIARTL
jgi:acyl-CoA dehydrogenase